VVCRGDLCLRGVDPRRQVTKVPRECYRGDGRGHGDEGGLVDAEQREGVHGDGKVHHKHILGECPFTLLVQHQRTGQRSTHVNDEQVNAGQR